MKTGMKVQMGGFLKKIREFPSIVAREQESILKQEARAICVRYAQCTRPAYGLSFDAARAEGMKRRVESEVNRTFLTRDRNFQVFLLIKRRSPILAKAYFHAWQSKNERRQTAIMREAGVIIETLQPAVHKSARTGPGASVPKNHQPTVMISLTQLRAYGRRQAALVGFAQAGWYAAARGLGGRIRRNLRDPGGKRSTVEAFPSYIRKLANKHPGIGGARILSTGPRTVVEIWTSVRHAEYALPDYLKDLADDDARASVSAALRESIRYLNQKRLTTA